jgi:hypothetical protein
VFEDRASGAQADRAGLLAALSYARHGDVLIVWKLEERHDQQLLARRLHAQSATVVRSSTSSSGAMGASS